MHSKSKLLSQINREHQRKGAKYERYILNKFSKTGITSAKHIYVFAKDYHTKWNVDFQITNLVWSDSEKYDTFIEVKQSVKDAALTQLIDRARVFKENYPNNKYIVLYQDGGIVDTTGQYSDFKSLSLCEYIDAIVPESKFESWISNPNNISIPSQQMLINSVYAELNRLNSYDPKLNENIMSAVKDSIGKHDDKIKVIHAPTAFGKTHLTLYDLLPYFVKEHDIKLTIITAPQIAILDDGAIRTASMTLASDSGGIVEVVNDLSSLRNTLTFASKHPDSNISIIYTLTDAKLRTAVYGLVDMIHKFKLKNKFLFIRDEASYGGTSDSIFYKENLGYTGNKLPCTTYSNLIQFKSLTSHFYALTATPIKEQTKSDFGSNMWHILNEYPDKYLLNLRLSAMSDNVNRFDFENMTTSNASNVLENMVNSVFNHESKINKLVDVHNLNDELRKKLAGLIRLETKSSSKTRITTDVIVKLFKKINIFQTFNFVISTSNSILEYRYYRKDSCKFIGKLEITEQELYDRIHDKNDPIKFYIVVNKGNMGVNIMNLCSILSFREPSAKDNSKSPVINNGIQLVGRCTRLVSTIDSLYDYIDDKSLMIRYFTLVNSYSLFVPFGSYWDAVIDDVMETQPTTQDVISHLTINL